MPHIEIIGGVGSGKSALAQCLAEQGFRHVEEIFETNPFLEKFHKFPYSCAPEFGMAMLGLHRDRINEQADPKEKQVFDFSLVTNLAYALTYKQFGMFMLKRKAGAEYIEACTKVRDTAVRPALRVYLKLSPEAQKQRILKRGRELEKGTPKLFLSVLAKNLDRAVQGVNDNVPTLVIDAEKYDWVNSAADKREIARLVSEAIAPRAPAPKPPGR